MRKSQPLLQDHTRFGMDDAGSESYSSSSSFSDSYSDGSDLANWEEFVADDGSLFYAEYMPHAKRQHNNAKGQSQTEKSIEFTRNSSLRMGKKAARRQQQQQQQRQQQTEKQHRGSNRLNGNLHQQQQHQQQQQYRTEITTEFKFSQLKSPTPEEIGKKLELVITAADRYRFGRRSTAVESILGFRVVPFSDKPECLMVDGFVHDMPELQQQGEAGKQSPIQRGDWFKSLDDIDIRTSNVDELLMQFLEPTKVCLKFQGIDAHRDATAEGDNDHGTGADGGQQLRKIENFPMFAQSFEQLLLSPQNAAAASAENTTTAMPFFMLVLPPECYQNEQHKDSLYFYPENPTQNFLYKARGSFLTLNAVLTEELQTKPFTSRLLVEQIPYYVCYRSLNGFLVLFAYLTQYNELAECSLRSDELIGYMRFAFPTLNLESFAKSNASSVVVRKFLYHFCEIQRVRLLVRQRDKVCQFESLHKESRSMPLPKEAQLRIFDALSEMEAMDYRNWNDEPLTTHREFFIYGSVLYYDCYMLTSQLPVEVRIQVEGFLRCRGLFDFIATHSVRELYVWEEIALPNATGRYFLTLCTRGHLILAVILKIFDAPDMPPDAIIPPSLFYIEEIQETLDHLVQCGIESLAMFWSISNKRPEVLDSIDLSCEDSTEKDSRKLETFIKQKLTISTATGSGTTASGGQRASGMYDDDGQVCSSLGGSSIHSLTPSEDDSSRKRLTVGNNGEDSDSGSDWENFAEQHPLHCALNSETQTLMSESLWKEINNVVPVKISAGWKNSVFYFVYVDTANGTLFSPLKANFENLPFLHEMRIACHAIREVLQDTKNLRRQLADSTKSSATSSKGALAVKEHGITIEVRHTRGQGTNEEQLPVKFVVVGRLFHSPTKEVYICHRPEVPQNMVEMAFRLSFFSVG